ncbi:M23 family metallopeptidase [Cryobacterium soli]|uniref:M23 family metallopeptidase n=1 Tax=Cryobacterium soli TaxID=2220095 RepID=UPI000E71E0D7|nr:M23 family metallopeptidase [Cryobacterium soli]
MQSQDYARAATAVATAEGARAAAQSAYDAARVDLAATVADHVSATTRVDEVRALAEAASTQAAISSRALATLVRAMVQRGADTTTLDALLGDQDSAELLSRLGIVDRISELTGSLDKLRERVDKDQLRASRLQADLEAAQAAAQSFPLADKQAALSTAEVALGQATAALASATTAAQAVLAESASTAALRSAAASSQLAGTVGARLSGQGWATPAVGIVNDGFGPRPNLPLPGVEPFHSGTDLAAACGTPVYAASTGVVAQTGQLGTYGNWILIDHGDGVATGYAHIRDGETWVSLGETVTAGQVIAGVGSTGASTGCHLHIEVRVDGTPIDPQPFFAARGITLGAG